jgi:hypothetical protein
MCHLCYTVAAEEAVWNYAPTGYNNYDNTTLDEGNAATFLTNTKALIGPKYKKARYIEYTDGNFTTVKPTPEWLGFVGPIIRAEVSFVVLHCKRHTDVVLTHCVRGCY